MESRDLKSIARFLRYTEEWTQKETIADAHPVNILSMGLA